MWFLKNVIFTHLFLKIYARRIMLLLFYFILFYLCMYLFIFVTDAFTPLGVACTSLKLTSHKSKASKNLRNTSLPRSRKTWEISLLRYLARRTAVCESCCWLWLFLHQDDSKNVCFVFSKQFLVSLNHFPYRRWLNLPQKTHSSYVRHVTVNAPGLPFKFQANPSL